MIEYYYSTTLIHEYLIILNDERAFVTNNAILIFKNLIPYY